MAKKTVTLAIEVTFDDDKASADKIECAMDVLLDTALSTPNIFDELGEVEFKSFNQIDGEK